MAAHPFLKKEIDWDNNGVDNDLNMIADSMGADWEVTLSVPLELLWTDISDLKTTYSHEHPCLLRYDKVFIYNSVYTKTCKHSVICCLMTIPGTLIFHFE